MLPYADVQTAISAWGSKSNSQEVREEVILTS